MRFRTLGKTGLEVSEIGFGAEWIGKMDDAEVRAIAKAAHDAGVNIVDCWMADPAVRSALGRAIEPERDDWIIQGHIGSTWQDGQYVRTRDMSKVVPAFEDQLERLRTDHVELGMIHYVDDVDEFKQVMAGEFFEYVQKLLSEGKIEHIGLSTHNPDVALLAVEDGRIEMIMFSVNPAFDLMPATNDINEYFGDYEDEGLAGMDPIRAKLYAACESANIGITVMKGLAGGRLLDAAKSPFGVALTPAQCLHYCLTRPAVCSVMVGLESVAQLEEAIALETATAEELDYASVLAGAPKHSYYGQCTYCGHCAPCVVGINIALVNKFADLAEMQPEVPESVREHYRALDVTAEACIGCADCESRCPFGVPIATKMASTLDLFGS
ncbi:MAG: aldo/keto reductase [Eggerthellaceae bacterium]|nr:aldo/keto reductase [Eggerthellaceae bacterium]